MKTNIDRVYSKMPQKKHNFENHKVELGALDEDAKGGDYYGPTGFNEMKGKPGKVALNTDR